MAIAPQTAYELVQDELGRLDTVLTGKAERLRDLEAARLDWALRAIAPAVKKSDPLSTSSVSGSGTRR